ncbi:MAG: RNA pyrophosphohydrolase, partial [Campylobacter sp.]|nr:RNA pyrophosphohydrolase [Campylobacter sp.]
MQTEKKYRPNVAAIVLSPSYPFNCEVFIAQRSDIKGAWQFPQGGIDKGETPKVAILRELKEEIGTDKVEIIAECPDWHSYDFPQSVADKMKPYDGQKQKYFLVRLKKVSNLNINTKNPEFD